MLGQTDRHTNIGPTTFFQRPTRGNLRAKAFNAKALKPFYSTILNKCQCHLMQSEALPILSSSSGKDESNAVFPVSIGLQVLILDAILSSCMARTNDTYHVQFREHPDIDTNTSPSLAFVERRRSSPNRLVRLAAMTKYVKLPATCPRHVLRGTKPIAIAT